MAGEERIVLVAHGAQVRGRGERAGAVDIKTCRRMGFADDLESAYKFIDALLIGEASDGDNQIGVALDR